MPGRGAQIQLCVLIASLAVPPLAAQLGSKGVSVSLRAKWEGTPLLLEAFEYVAEEAPSKQLEFIAAWQKSSGEGTGCWDSILLAAGTVLSASQHKVLQVVLAVRQYSPRLEFYRTQAAELGPSQDTCCFVDIGGQQVNTTEALAQALAEHRGRQASQVQLQPFDHILVPEGATVKAVQTAVEEGAGRVAVLYGAVGTACFARMHRQLLDAAGIGGGLSYVYRPVLLGGCGGGDACVDLGTGELLQLPGFGVELAIKNMEYSAMDDSKVAAEKEAAREAGEEDDGPLEVQGFLFRRLLERAPGARQELLSFRDHLLASAASDADEALKVWNMKELGLQAAQRIAAALDPLRALGEVAQNFPNLAAPLSRVAVAAPLRHELQQMHRLIPGGSNFLLVNGMLSDAGSADLYSTVDLVRNEVRLAGLMQQTGLQEEDNAALLRLRSQMADVDASDMRVDLAAGGHIAWANDLETGRMYWTWPSSVMDLLRPAYPGQLAKIQRNLLNLIGLVDPGTLPGLRVASLLLELYSQQWPVRFGAVLLPAQTIARVRESGMDAAADVAWDDLAASERAAVIFTHMAGAVGAPQAFKFLARIRTIASKRGPGYVERQVGADGEVTDSARWPAVEAAFGEVWAEMPEGRSQGLEADEALQEVIDGCQEALQAVVAQAAWAIGKGVATTGGAAVWLNGLLMASDGGLGWAQMVPFALQMEQQRLQEAAYFGRLQDSEDDMLEAILRIFKAVPKHNPRLLEAASDDDDDDASEGGAVRQLALIGPELSAREHPWSELGYLHHPGSEDDVKGISHWLIADLNTKAGQALMLAALEHLEGASARACRIAFVHNPAGEGEHSLLARAILAASALPSRRPKIGPFLQALLREHAGVSSAEEVVALAKETGLNEKGLEAALGDNSRPLSLIQACRSVLGLAPGAAAVVTNGRLVPLPDAEPLVAEDFDLLALYANSAQVARQVAEVAETAMAEGRTRHEAVQAPGEEQEGAADDEGGEEWTAEQLSDAALMASSVLAANGGGQANARASKVVAALKSLRPQHTNISIAGSGGLGLEVWAVLDPLSKVAQRVAPILDFLRRTLAPTIKVFLNPSAELPDLPLKSFYRYALPDFPPASSSSSDHLSMPGPPAATFTGLPARKVLTLGMDVPEAWLVEAVRAEPDLDNLRLADLGAAGSLQVEYELEALLLTGSCVDVSAKRRDQVTPRGVQLVLGTAAQPNLVDTLVMANLAYFQLKAAPGAFHLALAPGRSRQLYTVDDPAALGQDGENGTEGPVRTRVAIDSLAGKAMRLNVRKRPGFEDEDVLGDAEGGAAGGDGGASLLGKVSSWLVPSSSSSSSAARTGGGGWAAGSNLSAEDDPEAIHIFTVASGHMYERLQKIMVLSVLRTTKARVKFWFIKNYMSPQMKRFLPHMAARYGFEYEAVTYKWPSWLHKQTEKQRIIWAYKILFLDVLFPLSLRKVIFADADQIIRADFAELWHMDLKGAPLAYTPFCDNNRDMEGFRFWKQGFWKDHLRGRPYHISALYVVDLARFRQMAAGDQLRVVYDQLSRDPASLSNLDQDLPNYAQHQVPIFSLPQEWLWCETWCGNATKRYAKTIDLCNNPLTKEPKLDSARRIVAEWPALDEEVAAFTAQVEARWAQQQLGRQWEAPEEGPGDEQGGGGGEGDDAGLQEEPALQVGASEELRQAGASRHDASEL